MMKKILIFILLFTSYVSFSQGEANNWYFGYSAGIQFTNGSVVNTSSNPSIKINTEEGCSTFSDSAGNLLFYSDGKTVWNAKNKVMPNGSNLLGSASSSQSVMIIPKPENENLYYLFTVGANIGEDEPGFNYYTLDITEDGGLGDIIEGPINLSGISGPEWSEKVAAVKGAECNTFWVISYDGNSIKSYKVDSSGVNKYPVSSVSFAPEYDPRGYLKVSPDGKKLAIAHYALDVNYEIRGEEPGESSLLLYDFNDATGKATNRQRLFDINDRSINPYGLEFSKKSSKLYASTFDGINNSVYQFDIESSNVANSEKLIHKQIGYRGALQLGPNGKIYSIVPVDYWNGTKYLDIINYPERLGAACDYREDAIYLGSGIATQGLPPFISSLFLSIEITGDNGNGDPIALNDQLVDLCAGSNLTISPELLVGVTSYEWIFNNTTISTTKDLILTNINIIDIGNYTFKAISIDDCGRQITRQGDFSIASVTTPPIANPVSSQFICDDDSDGFYIFNLATLYSSLILNGQDPLIYEVKYFNSQINADTNSNPLPLVYTSSSTTIFARIQGAINNSCYDITSFDVVVFGKTFQSNIPNLSFCDNTSVGTGTDGLVIFDLTQRETDILNGLSSTDFTLTYFTDANYLNLIGNPINFQNTISGGQTIYVRMTNNLEVNCYTDTSFEIIVNQLPEIQSYLFFKNCDEDEFPKDGFTDFNLEEANEYITNKNNDLIVTYHLSIADAESGIEIPNPLQFNNITQRSILARVESTEGCYRIASIDLQTSTTSFEEGDVIELEICDDDNIIDGLHLFNLADVSVDIISNYPPGQNLTVQFYKNKEDAQLERNEILPHDDYMSETPFHQIIYGRVESLDNGSCFGIGPYVSLTVHPRPEFEVIPLTSVCVNLGSATLETFNPQGDYSYQWFNENNDLIGSTATVEVNTGGEYNVIATSGLNCASFSQIITVIESDVATISQNDITITDDSNNNTVSINNANQNLGIGDYEFSLDDEFGSFQDEPFFERVLPGIHTIFVRDKNNCGMSLPIDISVIGFPKFFTPNNDGQNDYWKVLGVNQYFFPTSLIYIYDRYGKILAKVNPLGKGWDGYYNGTQLPSDDYWFSVQLKDVNGVVKNRKGHFSIIRR